MSCCVYVEAKLFTNLTVHVFVFQVIVFQAYKNNSTAPIEAKYVFPLDDMAAGMFPNHYQHMWQSRAPTCMYEESKNHISLIKQT